MSLEVNPENFLQLDITVRTLNNLGFIGVYVDQVLLQRYQRAGESFDDILS